MTCTREICKICYEANPIGFKVPDKIWVEVVPLKFQGGVVCISCFIHLADEQLVPWDINIKLYPVSLRSMYVQYEEEQ